MLFNSMIGKQIDQEAHMDAVSESAVTAQTHAMEKVGRKSRESSRGSPVAY